MNREKENEYTIFRIATVKGRGKIRGFRLSIAVNAVSPRE